MHAFRTLSISLVLISATAAAVISCGSSSSPNKTVDAATTTKKDAAVTNMPDAAPTGLTGLGEKCGSGGVTTCPSDAPMCIGFTQGGPTYCTPTCLTGATGTTNGSGQFVGSGSGALTPAPDDATCTGVYSGGASGVAACDIIAGTTPMAGSNGLAANTAYTAVSFVCSVNCGGTTATPTCPTGMTCQTGALAGLCLPD